MPREKHKLLGIQVTCTPLAGNRYRLNGVTTKEGKDIVVSGSKVKATKRSLTKAALAKAQGLEKERVSMPSSKIDRSGDAKCPICDKWNYGYPRIYPGKIICKHCHQPFIAVTN